jgi:hypothetical protein
MTSEQQKVLDYYNALKLEVQDTPNLPKLKTSTEIGVRLHDELNELKDAFAFDDIGDEIHRSNMSKATVAFDAPKIWPILEAQNLKPPLNSLE